MCEAWSTSQWRHACVWMRHEGGSTGVWMWRAAMRTSWTTESEPKPNRIRTKVSWQKVKNLCGSIIQSLKPVIAVWTSVCYHQLRPWSFSPSLFCLADFGMPCWRSLNHQSWRKRQNFLRTFSQPVCRFRLVTVTSNLHVRGVINRFPSTD